MFEDIRPYTDEEAKRVWLEMLRNPDLVNILKRLGVTILPEYHLLDSLESLHLTIAALIIEKVLDSTSDGLTFSGTDALEADNGRGFLFISNHRDIILDPALLVYAYCRSGYKQVQIAVGDNLFTTPFVTDLIKANRSFVVKRNLPRREQLKASRELSAYIWHQIKSGQAIWIAQREGRAKDGNDFTNPAMLSMLHLSERKSIPFSDFINQINIVPVSISYEYDPCDEPKARELWTLEQNHSRYEKGDNEDVSSIVKGVTGYKGRIHIAFGSRLEGDFLDVKAVVRAIDNQIITNYRLWPSNLSAYGELSGNNSDVAAAEKQKFLDRVNNVPEELRTFILNMYASPVRNKRAVAAGQPLEDGTSPP
ncbi:MAG: 1-acyl-sn-glycerol-3-phosphate acyltransferase [Deltaproteobacteria bacterium]|nr:1-acyl-sn-glycerol-3-phosphate acyltransferase [Deltaproteobacteria bacterium]